MKNILTVIKKEFSRFFRDKRLVLSLILPGVLIYFIYSFLGDGILSNVGGTDENYVCQVYTVNMPDAFKTPFESLEKMQLHEISADEADEHRQAVADQEEDLLVVFPENFEEDYNAVLAGTSTELPRVNVYYNTVRTEGTQAYTLFAGVLSVFQQQVTPYFLSDVQDLASEKDMTGMIFSMIAPMLVLMFLFSGCMAVAPESIAGEKERGTLATMLVTPVRRSHIAAGKIIALSTLSLLSGLCSFLGIILSLPKLMGAAGSLSAAVYTIGDYAMLLGIVLSSVLVIVALVSVVSAFAKSVKEATAMIGPLMILVMLLGVSTMFSSGSTGSYLWYLIPLYNSARAMNGVFSFAASPVAVLITVVINVVAAVGLAFLLAKMFDSEKIMFNK
ncbi:MAG TPA: ABC transporter permease [Candidatus Scatosoma pullistercoris]|uniref:ABC transporter permease n=1 Tax=Candidatus Scatosoma pullistercoris TaxID=2840934 RepID=A0A9D1SGC7_9FIRM|nr:ABC transporter permease [Candidatus Scatosoma pullistercoris]